MNTIYTLGYANKNSQEELDRLLKDNVKIVDIRLVPLSRWKSSWTKGSLQHRLGSAYVHLPGLGNVNYSKAGSPIVLKDPYWALVQIHNMLEVQSVCLLCACKSWGKCHRHTVLELLLQQKPMLSGIHLGDDHDTLMKVVDGKAVAADLEQVSDEERQRVHALFLEKLANRQKESDPGDSLMTS